MEGPTNESIFNDIKTLTESYATRMEGEPAEKVDERRTMYAALKSDIGEMGDDATTEFLATLLADSLARYSGKPYVSKLNPTVEDINALDLSDEAKKYIMAYFEIAPHANANANVVPNNNMAQGGGYKKSRKAKKSRKSKSQRKAKNQRKTKSTRKL